MRDKAAFARRSLEEATHKAIRDEGWLLPELEHEVAESESDAAEESIELPQSLADPLAVLDRDLSQRQRPPREHSPDQSQWDYPECKECEEDRGDWDFPAFVKIGTKEGTQK